MAVRKECGYKRGDIILSSEPFAHVLCDVEKGKRCDYCTERCYTLKCCVKCKKYYYCDKDCQVKDWELHKHECKLLKLKSRLPDFFLRLLARTIFKLKYGAEMHETVGDTKIRFHDLDKDSYEDINKFLSVLILIRDFIGVKNLPPPQELKNIILRVISNTRVVMRSGTENSVIAIHLGITPIRHSCTPNAVIIREGRNMNIRAISDIPEKALNKITCSRLHQIGTKEERLKQLREQRLQICNCTWCSDEEVEQKMTEILDPKLAHGPNGVVAKSQRALITMRRICENKGHAFEVLKVSEDCLVMQTDVLGEKNLLRLNMLIAAFCACKALNISRGLNYGYDLLSLFKYYYGEFHPVVSDVLYDIGKLMLATGHPEEAEKTLIQALEILSVTHKPKNPRYQKVIESIDECQKSKFTQENAFRDFAEMMQPREIFSRMWM